MINIIVFGILNLLLDILLVRQYGYMGIAYAKLLVVILGSLSLIILYRHALQKKA
jgi:peptidoglycan biosynthesis protein MviN/MurJ (putative lipid II flippase)